jgi:hypothetical protein
MRLLAKTAEERYQSPRKVLIELGGANHHTLDKGTVTFVIPEKTADERITDADGVMRHPMRRIVFVLVAVVALAGVVAYVAPHLDKPMERTTRTSEAISPLDTAIGG